MSVDARELKPPSPGAGAPRGPLKEGPALGEDGNWGAWAEGQRGRAGGRARDGGLMPSS